MKIANNNSRRSFIKKGAIAAFGIGVLNTLNIDKLSASTSGSLPELPPVDGAFELPKLGYEFSALEPYIDTNTMTIHYTKHHQTYITKLNEALDKAPEFKNRTLFDLISNLGELPESIRTAVRNHGGGHFNHTFFWKVLTPPGPGSNPSAELKNALEAKWQTMDNLKAEFTKLATGVFGSGWAWIIKDKENNLSMITTPNQDSPVMDIVAQRGKPILAIDVWEHAYYLKHQNKRADYINDYWNVIDWNQVSKWYGEG